MIYYFDTLCKWCYNIAVEILYKLSEKVYQITSWIERSFEYGKQRCILQEGAEEEQ